MVFDKMLNIYFIKWKLLCLPSITGNKTLLTDVRNWEGIKENTYP